MASDSFHEPFDLIDAEVRERHRAIASLIEELEAVDWYDQRISVTRDAELRAVLEHNRDEEKEHAAMLLEWLRRNDPTFATHLAEYLDRAGPISAEAGAGGPDEGAPARSELAPGDGSLGIGSLRRT